jgi:hypothetical protein
LKILGSSLSSVLILCSLGLAAGASPDPVDNSGQEIIDRYLAAQRLNQPSGLEMDAEIQARLPKLKKIASLQALRKISKLGKITWDRFHFSGDSDSTIKKEVISRFIQNEQEQTDTSKSAINLQNYKFKYKGLAQVKDGKQVYVFHLTPRKNTSDLFKGELWLDEETCLPVHEAGTFVKSPNRAFLTKVQFVRDYELINGFSIPSRLESQADTRFWGPAHVSIRYNNFVKATDEQVAESVTAPEQPASQH